MKDSRFNAINVFVSRHETKPIYEELPARKLDDHTFELLASPGLALNLAKGDIIAIRDPNAPATVVKRGGNFCVQVYSDEIFPQDLHDIENVINEELNGSLDGVYRGNLAVTVPSATGMQKIRHVFDEFSERTGSKWYFCNIYKNFDDVNDETLLEWWEQAWSLGCQDLLSMAPSETT